jgi:hypothetical protein
MKTKLQSQHRTTQPDKCLSPQPFPAARHVRGTSIEVSIMPMAERTRVTRLNTPGFRCSLPFVSQLNRETCQQALELWLTKTLLLIPKWHKYKKAATGRRAEHSTSTDEVLYKH